MKSLCQWYFVTVVKIKEKYSQAACPKKEIFYIKYGTLIERNNLKSLKLYEIKILAWGNDYNIYLKK